MSARINTILILGAAGGIGEAMAYRFHNLGKKVIITGREQNRDKMEQMAQELLGLDFRAWDMTDLENLQNHVKGILTDYPKLDSVFINGAIQNYYQMFEQPPDAKEITRELTTNLTAPILIAHTFTAHLLTLARSGTKTNLFLTSSSLAYFPVPFYPAYCSAKAGIASFTKILRMQLQHSDPGGNMNVVEVVPPYVDTPLNATHRDQTDELQGGPDKAVQPMPLAEYIDKLFANLEQTKPDGSFQDEVGVGFGAQGAKVWNEGFQKLLTGSGMLD
ncbi:putative oxidoreductase DltE [Cladobotryum mycophilum]|uniref:Oxidoreductase DltE n=1 Tax=Cladobotryum mycophilum TaxID=491253 RepID=A0ABR0SQ88_9HYPO